MNHTHSGLEAYSKGVLTTLAMILGTSVLMAACSTVKPPPKAFSQDTLPDAVRVPPGHQVVLETTAIGVLNYECKANTPTAGTIGWVLVSPKADLLDRTGKSIGNYSGPPATWAHTDGSSVVGSQLAIAPVVGAAHLPLQLSKGTPGMTAGALQNVSHVQRINTKGGQDFSKACTQTDLGSKLTLPYQADYIFWKAA